MTSSTSIVNVSKDVLVRLMVRDTAVEALRVFAETEDDSHLLSIR